MCHKMKCWSMLLSIANCNHKIKPKFLGQLTAPFAADPHHAWQVEGWPNIKIVQFVKSRVYHARSDSEPSVFPSSRLNEKKFTKFQKNKALKIFQKVRVFYPNVGARAFLNALHSRAAHRLIQFPRTTNFLWTRFFFISDFSFLINLLYCFCHFFTSFFQIFAILTSKLILRALW